MVQPLFFFFLASLSLLDGGCRTFSAAVELDDDGLVHVLGQVQDVLLLGPLRLGTAGSRCTAASSSASTASTSASVAAAASSSVTATAAASVERSIGHCGCCALAGGGEAEATGWARLAAGSSFRFRLSLSPFLSVRVCLSLICSWPSYSTGIFFSFRPGGRDSVTELGRGRWTRGFFFLAVRRSKLASAFAGVA